MANTVQIRDAANTIVTVSTIDAALTTTAAGPSNRSVLVDANTGVGAAITAFHNTDNQTFSGTTYGVFTGGVAQIVNQSGGLDRQRETSFDNIPSVGVATGTQQLASAPLNTTMTAGVPTANLTVAQAVVLANVSFTNRGVTSTIQTGSTLSVDVGTANAEYVYVQSVNTSTKAVTGIFTKGHAAAAPVAAFSYTQARDASIPDGSALGGVGASATFFVNGALNSGTGGVEIERSFLGELNGATGSGAAIAAEFEDTAGGPVLASGVVSGMRLTPAQSLQGKGRANVAITSTGVGNTTINFSVAANTNTIPAGHAIYLSGGATPEVVFTTQTWVPGSANAVPIQSPVVNAGQTTASWDVYAANGPALNGFQAFGIGIEEEALYDPVSALYYVERSATQDAMPPQNIVAEAPALFNGTTHDRQRSNVDTAALITLTAAAAGTVNSADQTNYNGRGVSVVFDLTTATTTSVVINIQGKDAASGKYYTILSSAAVTTVSTNPLTTYPGAPVTTNISTSMPLPRTWRVQAVVTGASSAATGTVGASVIV